MSWLGVRACPFSPRTVRATVVKELMAFHPVIHTHAHTLRASLWKSVYVLKSISSWRHGCILCIWTLTHRKYVKPFKQTASAAFALSPLWWCKEPPPVLANSPCDPVRGPISFLLSFVCLVYFSLLCSLFLSFKTSVLWELEFYDVCDFH